jgi:hypothetical protein
MKTTCMITAALAASASASAIPEFAKRGSVSVTPHDIYSSSIGVLGCKINTNRVAYWPGTPSCNNICVKVSAKGRSVNLLKIDSSGGAYDISYDAWNYLLTGESAQEDPQAGGGLSATYEDVDMSECADLIKPSANGKLAFSAANSINFVVGCGSDSWVGQNHELLNIADPTCSYGVDDVCKLNMAVSNQPQCENSKLGVKTPLTSDPVYNILYPSGEKALATI